MFIAVFTSFCAKQPHRINGVLSHYYLHGSGKKKCMSNCNADENEVIKIVAECKRSKSTCSDSKISKSNCRGFAKK
jgi:hypothetical protein